MKNTVINIFLSSIIIGLITFIFYKKSEENLSNILLIEQSKELTLANGRELSDIILDINEDNLSQNKDSSLEYEQVLKLYNDFDNFKLKIEKANHLELIQIINLKNLKFKNEDAFKMKYFKFKPVNIEKIKQLDKDVIKFYVESKISRFYVQSAAIMLLNHSRKQKNHAEL